MNKITWKPSPNFSSRNGAKVTHIIIHVTQGNTPGCVNWLCNPKAKASAHYVITKKGEIFQLVKLVDKAWHVLRANSFTIGIEHEGFIADPKLITKEMWNNSIELTTSLCKQFNIPTENIMGHNDPFLKQYGNNHQDPGPYWNMNKYRNDVSYLLKHESTKSVHKIDQAGLEFLKSNEGIRLRIYDDATGYDLPFFSVPEGNASIGIGHVCNWTERALYSNGITEEKALQLLENDLKNLECNLNNLIKVELNQNQWNSLVSFAFNIGLGSFASSTLLKLLNERNIKRAANQFHRWKFTTINGKKVISSGLMKRRDRELELFNA